MALRKLELMVQGRKSGREFGIDLRWDDAAKLGPDVALCEAGEIVIQRPEARQSIRMLCKIECA